MLQPITDKTLDTDYCLYCGERHAHTIVPSIRVNAEQSGYEVLYQVQCLRCESMGPIRSSPNEALKYWNNPTLIDETEGATA